MQILFQSFRPRAKIFFRPTYNFIKQTQEAETKPEEVKEQPKEEKQPKQNKKQKQQQQQQQKFDYQFTQEDLNIDRSIEQTRLNKKATQYTIPQEISKRNQPEFSMGENIRIENIHQNPEKYIGTDGTISGWAKTIRLADSDRLLFVEINDGTTHKNLQVVITEKHESFQEIKKQNILTSFRFHGDFVKNEKSTIDLNIINCEIIGNSDKSYPLAKKGHSLEFLRDQGHLRFRTNFISCITRIRNALAYCTHIFFQSSGFLYIHTPLITCSDCEGAGEMFQVTTILPKPEITYEKIKRNNADKTVDYTKDFFGKPAFLTVSGQLSLETVNSAIGNSYTFGPTFRAENSNTTRHLAEFWMIEPEIIFGDLSDNMDLAESYIQFCVKYVLDNNLSDVQFLNERQQEINKKALESKQKPKKGQEVDPNWNLQSYLDSLLVGRFERITYTDAIRLLQIATEKGQVFDNKPVWGEELATEHERFLAEYIFKRPIMVYNYPKDCKAFYMRANEDDKTVAAFDCLVPGIGELVGGAQREERLDVLQQKYKEKGLNEKDYWWYNDLRKYGTVPHAGFGVGFERLVMLCSGAENIRDVIPFPRGPKKADF